MILQYRFNKNKNEVKKHFESIENFAKIHPLIISYEPEKEGYYKVTESVLPFTPKIKYLIKILDSKILDSKDEKIKMEAFLFNRRICIADIQITFDFESDANNENMTNLKEEVKFYTFAPFKPIFGLIFRYFHIKIFKKIDKL